MSKTHKTLFRIIALVLTATMVGGMSVSVFADTTDYAVLFESADGSKSVYCKTMAEATKLAANDGDTITLLRDVDTNIFEKLTDAEKENLRGQLGRLSTVVERFDTMIEDGTSTDKVAAPETPKTVVTKVVSNTVEKPRFYIAKRHADEPFVHCLAEGKTITNLGMSIEFEPICAGQHQKTTVEYRAFFIDETNEIISDVKPVVLCSGERCKVTFALNPKASSSPICMLALQSSADKPDELQQLIPFAVNISFTSDFDF